MHLHLTIFLSLLIASEVEGGCSNSGTNVRLVGGVDGVGRLEINRNLGKWGSVCMDNWRPVNSLVVCRELCGDGNDAETISGNNIPGDSPSTIHFTNVRCMGEEKSITECPMLEASNLRCNTRSRVGVSCVKRSCSGGEGIGAQLGISARCEYGAMVALVNKSANGGVVDSFTLAPIDPMCTDGQPGSNSTHLWLRLPYTKCGQHVAENDTWRSYETRFRIATLSGGTVVSTLTEYLLPVKCALNKITNQVIHIVGNSTIGTDELEGLNGTIPLTLNIKVFLDADYSLPVPIPAHDLAVGTLLYVRLELDPKRLPANGTKLFVKNCVGMPEADTSDATLHYYIIKDSCPNGDDDSADLIPEKTPHRVHFKFQTFKFGQNNNNLYLSCLATVCVPGDTSSLCRPPCANVQHPQVQKSLTLSKREEGNLVEEMPLSETPPKPMGILSAEVMLSNPDVIWPLNPTEDVLREDKNGQVFLLSNKGRLMRCIKNCKGK